MSPMDINALLGNSMKTTMPKMSLNNDHILASATNNEGVPTIERTHYSHPYQKYDNYGHGAYGYKKKGKGGSTNKKSIALTALTLLSFMYFLHILQSCIQDQMDEMNPQVVIMQARIQAREQEAKKRIGESIGVTFDNTTLLSILEGKKGVDSFDVNDKDGANTRKNIQEYEDREFSQIPVKVKTVQKKRYPIAP